MLPVTADLAFAWLADPGHLPEYLALVSHVESEVVDGEVGLALEDSGDEPAPVRFLADAAARRVEWARPGSDYAGEMIIEDGPIRATCRLRLSLRTSDASDQVEVGKRIDDAVRNIQRLIRR